MKQLSLILLLTLCQTAVYAQKKVLQRTIVTTDGELDDVDSFIRMLLYSNEYRVEGLVISSSQWHYKGDGKGTKFTSEIEPTISYYKERTELRWPGEQWIYDLVDAYGKVYPNLIKHSPNYPTAAYLKSLISIGNIEFEGEMQKDTDGSNFIKKKLLDDDMTPLYLQVWGGTNTIARALKSIEDEYKNTTQWSNIQQKVSQKAVIYAILDQDATYKKYISKAWPNIKIYYNSNQFWSLAYFWKKAVPKELHYLLEGEFMGKKIINNHGPLLKMYYSYGDGNPPKGELEDIYSSMEQAKKNTWGSFGQYDFISEGDSPAFLHLVNVGLDNLENPNNGGWGGRLAQSVAVPNRWEDGDPVAEMNPFTKQTDKAYGQVRWLEAIQHDFAARADWCIKDFKEANHAPNLTIKGSKEILAKAGQKIKLSGKAIDPDGDVITYKYWQYEEVDTYKGKVTLTTNGAKATFTVPADIKKGETIHLILEATDNGEPKLTRYQRIVVTGK